MPQPQDTARFIPPYKVEITLAEDTPSSSVWEVCVDSHEAGPYYRRMRIKSPAFAPEDTAAKAQALRTACTVLAEMLCEQIKD